MKDHYAILDIRPDASEREIKKAYRRRALKFHPTRQGNDEGAKMRFIDIAESYEILIDPVQRAVYDNKRAAQAEARHGQDEAPTGSQEQTISTDRSTENADSLFREEMLELGMDLARLGIGEEEIALKLARAGCPRELAIAVARQAEGKLRAGKSGTPRKEVPSAVLQIAEQPKAVSDYRSWLLAIIFSFATLAATAVVFFAVIPIPEYTASDAFYDGMSDYLRNDLGAQSLVSARIHFEEAVSKGSVQAKSYLGFMLKNGIGGPRDVERGRNLILEASNERDRLAQAMLAEDFVKSSSVDEFKNGIALMETSAAKGVITSQRWLCDHYTFFGKKKREFTTGHFFCMEAVRNDETIPGWIDSARLAKNSAEASATLAHQYYFGDGVRTDEEVALRWADEAIEGGASLGHWIKALAYQSGKGVKRDFVIARENLAIAAEAGLSLAQEYYADYLSGGIGGDRDLESALIWYRKAAAQGESSAQISVAELLFGYFNSEKGATEALAWILIAEQMEGSDKDKIDEVKQQILPSASEEQLAQATEMAKSGAAAMARWGY